MMACPVPSSSACKANSTRASFRDSLNHFGLMADNENLTVQPRLSGGIYDILDNKTAGKFMQNFRQVGFHPFSFAGGQNKGNFIVVQAIVL